MRRINIRRIRDLLHLNIWQDPRQVRCLNAMTDKIEELEARIKELEADAT